MSRTTTAYDGNEIAGVWRVTSRLTLTEGFTYGTLDVTESVARTFDALGNVTTEIHEHSTFPSQYVFYGYLLDLDRPLSLLTSTKKTSDADGLSVLSWSEYDFDPATCLRRASRIWDDVARVWLESTFGYDAYGNVTEMRDATGAITQTQYDDEYHTFAVSTILPANEQGLELIVESTYDPAFGGQTHPYRCQRGRALRYVRRLGSPHRRDRPRPNGDPVAARHARLRAGRARVFRRGTPGGDVERSHSLGAPVLRRAASRVSPRVTCRRRDVHDRRDVGLRHPRRCRHRDAADIRWGARRDHRAYLRSLSPGYQPGRAARRKWCDDDTTTTYPTVLREVCTEADGTPLARTTVRDYAVCDRKRYLVRSTDADGAPTTYTYDAAGRLPPRLIPKASATKCSSTRSIVSADSK